MEKETKFSNYLDASDWPDHMTMIRSHLLTSTTFDEEILSKSGNGKIVLQSLKTYLKSHRYMFYSFEPRLDKTVEEGNDGAYFQPGVH